MNRKLFDDLRLLAEQTRDKKLSDARAEYVQTIQEIAAMEQRLLGEIKAQRPKSKTAMRLQELICAIMPGDRAFTDGVQLPRLPLFRLAARKRISRAHVDVLPSEAASISACSLSDRRTCKV